MPRSLRRRRAARRRRTHRRVILHLDPAFAREPSARFARAPSRRIGTNLPAALGRRATVTRTAGTGDPKPGRRSSYRRDAPRPKKLVAKSIATVHASVTIWLPFVTLLS